MDLSRRKLRIILQLTSHLAAVILDAIGVLQLVGFLILITTYLTTGLLAHIIEFGQLLYWKAFHGHYPSRFLPKEKPVGIVFLAMGYTRTSWQLVGLSQSLQQAGYIVVHMHTDPLGNVHGFDDTVAYNRQRLEELASLVHEHQLPLIFLGVSKGGCDLVHLATAFHQAHRLRPDLFVTVQTPLQGSRLAKYGDHPGAAELIPGSPSVARTNTRLRELEQLGVELVCFCALYDEVVRRRDSRPDGHRYWSVTLPHVGHWGAGQNPWAINDIVGYITHRVSGLAEQSDQRAGVPPTPPGLPH